MNKRFLLFMIVAFSMATYAQNVNPYASAIWMKGSGFDQYYNLTSQSAGSYSEQINAINPGGGNWQTIMFTNKDFGAHQTSTGTLKLEGAEIRTIKNSAAQNVCSGLVSYRVNSTSPEVIGSFESNTLNFSAQCNGGNMFSDSYGSCLGTNDWQKWGASGLDIDLTQRNEGTYELEVYLESTGNNAGTSGCDDIEYINNSGANYKASYTICPSYVSKTTTKTTTCDAKDGSIVLTVKGIVDGTYSNRFFYDTSSAFQDVIVATSGGVTTATITKDADGNGLTTKTYENVRYNNPDFDGCEDIIKEDITIVCDQNNTGITGNFGIYATAVWLKSENANTFYNVSYSSPNGSTQAVENAINQDLTKTFIGKEFGAYKTGSNDLVFKGAEVRTYKAENGNTCSPRLNLRTYLTSNTPTDFEITKIPFYKECDIVSSTFSDGEGTCDTDGHQKWQGLSMGSGNNKIDELDLTSRNEGNYTLELFVRVPGSESGSDCDSEKFDNNSGANYKASYTICPSYVSKITTKTTTCDAKDGSIVLIVKGIVDGTYSNRFFYDANSAFQDVVVATAGGVTTATITKDADGNGLTTKTYENVRYNNPDFDGCEDIIKEDITIECDQNNTGFSGNFGAYATAVWFKSEGADTFYNISHTSPNGFGSNDEHAVDSDLTKSFQGKDFGVYTVNSNDLVLKGAEIRTFKQNSGNNCTPELNVRTYLTGATPTDFVTSGISFFAGCDLTNNIFSDGFGICNTDGYQKWQNLSIGSDLTARSEGKYTVELYVKSRGSETGGGCDSEKYDNNGGSNYKATFTICPSYTSGSKIDPTSCGATDGKITLTFAGLADGSTIYDGKFSHNGGVFADGSVTVADNVVTISNLEVGTYTNVVYTSATTGCTAVGGDSYVLVCEQNNTGFSGDFGSYATAVWFKSEGADTFYNVSHTSPNGFGSNDEHAVNSDLTKSFQGKDFGVYTANSNDLVLKGAEIRTFKQNSGNNCTPELNVRTYLTGATPTDFVTTRIPYFNGCDVASSIFSDAVGKGPCNTDGYQKWQGLSFGLDNNKVDESDLTARNEGKYTIELYVKSRGSETGGGCDSEKYDNNGGSNYKATFTICPTYVGSGIKTDVTTCGGSDGKIILNYVGLADGTDFYDGKFSYDGGVFANGTVSVDNNVVTISSLGAAVYSNIVYNSATTGCTAVGGGSFTIVCDNSDCPTYVSKTITNPTCGNIEGKIEIVVTGIADGTYSDSFFYDASSTFKDVVVTTVGGVITATITKDADDNALAGKTYENVRYNNPNTTGCEDIIKEDITLISLENPAEPTIDVLDCSQGFGNAILTVTSPLGAGFAYSIDNGSFQDSPIFNSVANGSHTITVRNSDGCTAVISSSTVSALNVNCDCAGGPDVNLSSQNGETCATTPITISNNTFSGSATQVTITHNGAGTLNQAVSLVSPFEIKYTPAVGDSGKIVTITVTTNNPLGAPCVEATPSYNLMVKENCDQNNSGFSGNYGSYATAVWLGSESSQDFYNVSYSSPNGFKNDADHAINSDLSKVFTGKDFGVHSTNSRALLFMGAEIKTFKEANANTCTPVLNLRTYLTGSSTPPNFETRDINYFVGCDMGTNEFSDNIGKGPCNTDGYQKWQGLSFVSGTNQINEFDLTSRKEGNYTLELYVRVSGSNNGNDCSDEKFDNNGGVNYKATYTICPTYVNGSKIDPTSCGIADGKIILNYSGLADGTDFYDGKFSYDGGVFSDGAVSVSNDVVTISNLDAAVYSNIVYTSSTSGCATPIGGDTFTVLEASDCLGNNDYNLNQKISVYPNPVNDVLHIDSSDISTIQSILIYNLQGQLIEAIEQVTDTSFDVSNLSNGIYLVKVLTANGVLTAKIVKE